MSAYYNEIDPAAAQWLRNLIEAGHIAPGYVDERSIEDVKPGQGLLASSAFGQEVDGKLGKEPKPFQATPCSRQTCVGQGAHARGGAQSLSRAILRTPHSILARSGSVNKSVCFASLAAVWFLFSRGKWPPSLAVAHGNFEQQRNCLRAGTRQSKAICCSGPGQSGKGRRSGGSYVLERQEQKGSSSAIGPCSGLSNIFYVSAPRASQRRSQRNEAANFSYNSTY